MRPIERITVHGWKSIAAQTIELRDLNVLIGANGSGKTNFISLFRLLSAIRDKRLQLFVGVQGGPEPLLHGGSKRTSEIDVELDFASKLGYGVHLVATQAQSLLINAELIWNDETGRQLGGGAPSPESTLDILRLIPPTDEPHWVKAPEIQRALEGLRAYHFHDTGAEARVKALCDLEDNVRLREDASNLAAVLYLLKHSDEPAYTRIVRTVRLAAPFFDDFTLAPSRLNPGKIQLEWRDRYSDSLYNAHSLSDGTLRLICLTTLFFQPSPPDVIVIDEPELGLHPYAIHLLAAMMRSASTRIQVIAATQSVTLLNQLAPEEIVVVDRRAEGSSFRRLSAEDLAAWAGDHGVGSKLEALAGFSP